MNIYYYMIELKNASVYYKNGFKLENINIRICEEKVLILGPNGSGKTTLIKAISGLSPYAGSISIDGREVKDIKNFTEFSTNLQEAYQIGLTVKDVIYLYEEIKNLQRDLFFDMLNALNLEKKILNIKITELSSGQSVLIRSVLALSSKPKIYTLDEPFENVDAARRYIISKFIMEYGREGIIVTHELDMLSLFRNYQAYFLIENNLYGPINISDLLESSIVEGEVKNALIVFSVQGKKISIVKNDGKMKFGDLGSLNRLYGIIDIYH